VKKNELHLKLLLNRVYAYDSLQFIVIGLQVIYFTYLTY